ncbi:hypothetical protein N781_00655 [Pontibacillus halophilus JSM 076056 = DSM 19796]|uniref:Uncharacterized protein n=1 Tax=Pontibacillus halophilus JSM 076056 = DSM 19796 TaxID=1385510 RepID=A0A0A5GLB9_9BACI|nr:hypothetical protein [Pontibacillus halophilus]KGX94056.1 hypothetical protein N781_00655 [Pontibacillus halophilus JSM 076056 = DSM 19796]
MCQTEQPSLLVGVRFLLIAFSLVTLSLLLLATFSVALSLVFTPLWLLLMKPIQTSHQLSSYTLSIGVGGVLLVVLTEVTKEIYSHVIEAFKDHAHKKTTP